ncbi:hypothetical protein CLM62_02725, partial [Streptomyces sp. SA15]|uniref:hypothetical protein n=1 Tax=Streptomyces sp. SA15 TaxID=934019 RepID=UPI000BCE0CB6
RDEAEARRAAGQADTLRSTDPGAAMRLALAAWRTADLPETREALRRPPRRANRMCSPSPRTADAR